MLLIGNGRLITRDSENPYMDNGAIVIDGNKIEAVGLTTTLKAKYADAEYMDARGRLIMPGIINAHQHFYSTLARGMANDAPPAQKFTDILNNLWWKLDKLLTLEDVYYSAAVPLIEGIKNGVTTVLDHHASPYHVEGSLGMIMEAGKDTGVRLSTCYEVSDRDGIEIAEAGIRENMAGIRAGKADETDMFKGMFGMHASMTISDETMDKCLTAMAGEKAGYHVHCAEGIEDVEDSLAKYGKRVITRWNDFGILNENSIAVHCIHVNDEEIDILRDSKVKVVHNPESNMGNAVGCAPLIEMKKRGVKLGLGTDGYTFDMFESWKVGNIIHKHVMQDSNVAWGELPEMLFEENANIVNQHFSGTVGKLKKGFYADVILVDYNPPTPMNKDNLNSHLLFGVMGRQVDTTIINGKIIMKDRILQGLDEQEIYAKSRQRAIEVWKQI